MQELFSALSLWLSAHPLITGWYTAIARLLFPVLSALILVPGHPAPCCGSPTRRRSGPS